MASERAASDAESNPSGKVVPQPPLRRVYVEKRVLQTGITRSVLERLKPGVPVEEVDDGREIAARFSRGRGEIARGKRTLLLTGPSAAPIKPCPGTLGYLCCGYEILNFATGCPLDCTYCILQDYFSNPLLRVQADADALLDAAAERLRAEPGRLFRLGTGEFADSLALDPLTGYSRHLVEFIRDFPNAVLELKTKSAYIDDLLDLDGKGRVVCAWSLNAPCVVEEDEFHVASLEERLNAAALCERAGYRLAFHFDPILLHEGWEEGYRDTISRVFSTVRSKSIVWISLGCFRYRPGLEREIRRRFPRNRHTFAEFVLGGDKKMRYPQPVRVHVYRKMAEWIREAGGKNVLLYFCMENPSVWRAVFGRCPRDDAELAGWLDEACRH